jgi:hypothetical protein
VVPVRAIAQSELPEELEPRLSVTTDWRQAMLTLFFGFAAWILFSLAIGALMILRTVPARSFHRNFMRIRLHATPVFVEHKRYHRRTF